MENTVKIKRVLADLEKEKDWYKIACFLYREWNKEKNNGELNILLIQQMMTYILDIDNGFADELHFHQNNAKKNREVFSNYLSEAVEYGLQNCINNKYFLWQMCVYYASISTYYPLLDNHITTAKEAESFCKKLLMYAHNVFPQSILFLCIEEQIKGNWAKKQQLNDDEKNILQEEIAAFALRENMADRIAEGYLCD